MHLLKVSSIVFLVSQGILLQGCEVESSINSENNSAVTTRLIAMPVNSKNQILLPDSALYEGEYLNNAFHGKGKLVWRSGNYYVGDFDKGLMHGKGEMVFSNGDTYKGGFEKGDFSGKGILKYVAGDHYEGDFRKSEWSGKGIYKSVDGDIYEGEFEKNMFQGKGNYKVSNGDVFEGDFKNNGANGMQTITFENGSKYVGEVENWKMQGKGEYVTKVGASYTGDFKDDKMNGKGVVIFEAGGKYEGDIKNWRGNGQGKFVGKKGSLYEGEFVNGLYEGTGVIKYKTGNIYKGDFKDGVRHGKGVYIRANPKGRKKREEGWWEYGDYVGLKKPNKDVKKDIKKYKKVDAEKIYYSQQRLLQRSLAKMKPSVPNVPDLYMISFASYGQQDVFMKEAQYSNEIFNKKFGTKNRSLMLINNPKLSNKVPLASVTNLKRSIEHIGGLMDKEEDILFLFLTSHGSKKHELSVSLRGVPMNDLPSKKLATILKESNIKWKVIVVSSCYSGGFIKDLKDDYTLIMTAAKDDHVSFGCSDEAEFTYFGRALFEKSISKENTFIKAFASAKEYIHKWENDEKYDHSMPQLWTTDKIESKLARWRDSL